MAWATRVRVANAKNYESTAPEQYILRQDDYRIHLTW